MLKLKKLLNGITYLRGAVRIKINSSLIVRSLRVQKRRHYWKSVCKLALFSIWLSRGSPKATSSFLPATPGNALESTSNKHHPVGNSRAIFLYRLCSNSREKLDMDFQKSNVWAKYPFLITNKTPNLGHYIILPDKGDLKLNSRTP